MNLDQHQSFRTTIPQIPEGISRPLWSVMIPTFNCAHYLRQTLASVLAQDQGPEVMQIEVVDDCSSRDDPEAIVRELGGGRVGFYRQTHNVGHTRNFDTCLLRSRGRLIHLLHGDDAVRDGFYAKLGTAFAEEPAIGAAFCRYIAMGHDSQWLTISSPEQEQSGVLNNWLEKIATGQRLQPPAMVVKRAVYERLGGFDRRISFYGEDWEMWVRIAANYSVWYEVEPLALYRVHPISLSGYSLRTGENMRDLRRVIEINRAYFPRVVGDKVSKQAGEATALAAIRRARRMLDKGEMRGPLAQMREALALSHSPGVIARTAFLFVTYLERALARAFM